MSETRRFDEVGAMQVTRRREPGAMESAMITSLSVSLAVLLLWLAALLLQWLDVVATWRAALAISVVLFASPFLFLAWGKSAYLRGKLEMDLYQVTGWKVDLDGDGQTGEAEVMQSVKSLPEREVIRVVPVHQASAPLTPAFRLPDGRELDAVKVRDFVVGADTVGLSLSTWKGRGWTRLEWETARDLLALHGLATERVEGQEGKLLATPGQCMRAFGL